MESVRLICFFFLYLSRSYVLTSKILTQECCPNSEDENPQDPCGSPLILTPYIKAGKIEEAQNLSRVHLKDAEDVESYSGFLTVDENCDSNLFFWFFPSEEKNENDPVILWLQGGPGGSSLYGLMYEIGPFYVDKGDVLKKRKYHWNDKRNLLFIDNPVGAGFSFTKNSSECYAHNEDDVRKSLYETILQFFELFPKLQKNDFFIFGESYAGKYIPAVAYSIHENNEKSRVKINLQGLGIGNGFSDPVRMLNYGELLYNFGMINDYGRREFKVLHEETVRQIESKNFSAAYKSINEALDLIVNMTYGVNIYNSLENSQPISNDTYLSREDVKSAIHASGLNFTYKSDIVEFYMADDYGKSVKPFVEKLLDYYRIMFYNGQQDICVGAVLIQNFLLNLNWKGAKEFQNKSQFGVMMSGSPDSGAVAYGTEYENLVEYRIRKSGHMVPSDQPKVMYNIMDAFVNNRTLRYIDLE